jgi:hypothetical protein
MKNLHFAEKSMNKALEGTPAEHLSRDATQTTLCPPYDRHRRLCVPHPQDTDDFVFIQGKSSFSWGMKSCKPRWANRQAVASELTHTSFFGGFIEFLGFTTFMGFT